LYWQHYGQGDTLLFHEEASLLADLARTSPEAYLKYVFSGGDLPFQSFFPEAPRARWFSQLISLFYVVTSNNYWLSGIYLSLFSWGCFWYLTLVLIKFRPKEKPAILFSLLYFPSVIFWTSGVSKESVGVGAIIFFVAILISLTSASGKGVIWYLFIAVIMVWVAWQVKYYLVGALMFSLALAWIIRTPVFKVHTWIRVFVILLVIPLGFYLLSLINPNFSISHFPNVVYDNYTVFTERSSPGSFAEFPTLCPSWGCLILTFPFAAATGFFVPFPIEVHGFLPLLASIENVILLILTVFSMVSMLQDRRNAERWTLLHLAGWIYCLALAGFLAMAAPNYGTLVRYKVGFLPFFLLLITMNNGYFYKALNKASGYFQRKKDPE
jgi:hypothetical protein